MVAVDDCAAKTVDMLNIDYQACSRPSELNSADITKKAMDMLTQKKSYCKETL